VITDQCWYDFGGYRYCNKTSNWVEFMLIFCILPAVEVMYVVTVLAPCVVPPVRYAVRNRAHTVVKPCPNRVQTMSPFAHAPFDIIDQTLGAFCFGVLM
jgi:hypothetical protein